MYNIYKSFTLLQCVNQRLQIQLELLMMSGIPLETCWAFNERWNNKFCYRVASCWLFLLNHTTMHGSINIKYITIVIFLPLNSDLGLKVAILWLADWITEQIFMVKIEIPVLMAAAELRLSVLYGLSCFHSCRSFSTSFDLYTCICEVSISAL
jgi:hypothetical protein